MTEGAHLCQCSRHIAFGDAHQVGSVTMCFIRASFGDTIGTVNIVLATAIKASMDSSLNSMNRASTGGPPDSSQLDTRLLRTPNEMSSTSHVHEILHHPHSFMTPREGVAWNRLLGVTGFPYSTSSNVPVRSSPPRT